jgi:hypothetical protein
MSFKELSQSLTDNPTDRPLMLLAVLADFLKEFGGKGYGLLKVLLFFRFGWTSHDKTPLIFG